MKNKRISMLNRKKIILILFTFFLLSLPLIKVKINSNNNDNYLKQHSNGPIIANHTIVDQYELIPEKWLNEEARKNT